MSYVKNDSKKIVEPYIFENNTLAFSPGEVKKVPKDELKGILKQSKYLKEVSGLKGKPKKK